MANNNKVEYFTPVPSREADKRASAKIAKVIHSECKDFLGVNWQIRLQDAF